MRLHKKLQKVMAIVALSAVTMTAMPVFANDYKGHWAETAIEKWSKEGVVEGYEDGTFRPKQAVTRAELSAVITRVFGLESTNGAKTYSDVSLTKWFAAPIKLVSAAGIMNDNGTMFRPNDAATREEAAAAIAKAYHITGGTQVNFKDAEKISEWALDDVEALVAGGYISGRPDGTFAPEATLTRADLVVMIDKITADLIGEAGTYNTNVKGNVVINTKDVVLKDMTIEGNLYIAEGVADGNVELNNVKVTGNVIVEGGGMNSVKVLGKSEIGAIVVDKVNDKVRLEVAKDAVVGVVELVSGAKLDGTFKSVVVKTTAPIIVGEKAKIEKMTVAPEAKGVKIDLGSGSEIKTLEIKAELKVTGKGTIKEAVVVDGVALKDVKIPANICDNVKNPAGDKVEVDNANPSTGGGGGGGGTVSDPQLDVNKVVINGGEKTIDLASNTINATYDGTSITINGVSFQNGDVIKTVAATGNVAAGTTVTVGAPGVTNYAQDLVVGTAYTSADAVKMMTANLNKVEDLIAKYNHKLTPAEQVRVAELFDAAKAALNEYKDGGDVSVSAVLTRAAQVKAKLNDPDVVAAWTKLEADIAYELSLLKVNITGMGTDNVTVTGTVAITKPGYVADTLTVSLGF